MRASPQVRPRLGLTARTPEYSVGLRDNATPAAHHHPLHLPPRPLPADDDGKRRDPDVGYEDEFVEEGEKEKRERWDRAIKRRDAVNEAIKGLWLPPNPLDTLIDRLGGMVSEKAGAQPDHSLLDPHLPTRRRRSRS